MGTRNPGTLSEKVVVRIDPDLRELIPGFLDNRRADIQRIRGALALCDFETVRSLGHNMKGLGGGYGFDAITRMGAALEAAAKSRDPDAVRRQTDSLSSYLDRLEIVIA